jgi:MFS family permease
VNRATNISGYAWVVVALLWPVAMLNYLDRQMLATIRTSIRADIPSIVDDQHFGWLMTVFMLVYAVLSPVGGYVADKINRRLTVIVSLFVWSAVTWATGHAQTYSQMFITRASMGVSEAFYMPAALALITDFHTGGSRAKAVGIHQSGIYTGLALGGIGGFIALKSSWRHCFTWFGIAGVIYSIVLMATLRDAPVAPEANGTKKVTVLETLSALWSQPAFWILVIYFTLPAIAGWIIKNWLPTFLGDKFNLNEGVAGISATGFSNIASFIGVILGGVVADWWMRRTNRGRIFTSAFGVLLLVPAMLGLGLAGNLTAAIAFMILFGIGWGFFDCNNMPILCQIARPEHRATGYGFMNMVSISVGACTAVGLGWMRDHRLPFSIAFAASAVLALVSAGLILSVKPKIEI